MLITNQHFLKQYIPIFILTAYLVNNKLNGYLNPFFSIAIKVTAAAIPTLIGLYHLGVNPLNYLQRTWTAFRTPIQYLVFILIMYVGAFTKTENAPYSYTLAIQSASAAGYLYEIPRYLVLQGFPGVIRTNMYSPFILEYSIIALFVVVKMVAHYRCTPTRHFRAATSLFAIYFIFYPKIAAFRDQVKWAFGYPIPWSNLYRLPAMLLLFSLITGLSNGPVSKDHKQKVE